MISGGGSPNGQRFTEFHAKFGHPDDRQTEQDDAELQNATSKPVCFHAPTLAPHRLRALIGKTCRFIDGDDVVAAGTSSTTPPSQESGKPLELRPLDLRYPQVQHPVQRVGGRTPDGIPYLQPEIALLYKAVRLRQVDEQDFHRVLPHLTEKQRVQLAGDIIRFSPQHPWLTLLR